MYLHFFGSQLEFQHCDRYHHIRLLSPYPLRFQFHPHPLLLGRRRHRRYLQIINYFLHLQYHQRMRRNQIHCYPFVNWCVSCCRYLGRPDSARTMVMMMIPVVISSMLSLQKIEERMSAQQLSSAGTSSCVLFLLPTCREFNSTVRTMI